MITHDEAASERLRLFFTKLGYAPFGSLWFVPEDVWKCTHARRYDQNSDRKVHAGCSLRRVTSDCSLDAVPMLHGTSKKAGQAVAVYDVFRNGRPTFFGGLPPVPISFSYWQGADPCRRCPKSALSAKEEKMVENLCKSKGWL